LTVPVPIPTMDGRLFADGLVVMTYVEGGPPETEADWRLVADTLRQLHRLPQGWPQRGVAIVDRPTARRDRD
jgi:Ser/Thr protein kinase RdoA (MazF antagonist)